MAASNQKEPRCGVLRHDAQSKGENSHILSPSLLLCLGAKNCVNLIRDPQRVWNMTRDIARNIDIDVIAIGGVANHVHLLMTVPPSRAMANIVRDLKANSSHILRQDRRMFRWQDGDAAISVSPSAVKAVVRYIEHQAEHHHARSFQDEYIAMLERAGIA